MKKIHNTITSFLEMDFLIIRQEGDERISNSWGGRLRHAFVKWQYNKFRVKYSG